MGSITADLKKLPLFLIAKGNDQDSQDSQLGFEEEINPSYGTHSTKAYMTTVMQAIKVEKPKNLLRN